MIFTYIITALHAMMEWLDNFQFHGITAWNVALFGIFASVLLRWFLPFFIPKISTGRDKSDGVRNR